MVETPHTKSKPAAKCDLAKERMRADDGLSQTMLPKASGFDILFYSWTTGIQGSSNFVQGPQGPGAQPHTRFQRARRFGLNKQKLLQFAVTSP
jgi:hypothetical protein